MLGIPDTPGNQWLRVCVDEAFHVKLTYSDSAANRRLNDDQGGETDGAGLPEEAPPPNLYTHHMSQPGAGRAPSPTILAMIPRKD